MLSLCLFVCLQDCAKTAEPIVTKFSGKMPRGQPVDFGSDVGHFMLDLGL